MSSCSSDEAPRLAHAELNGYMFVSPFVLKECNISNDHHDVVVTALWAAACISMCDQVAPACVPGLALATAYNKILGCRYDQEVGLQQKSIHKIYHHNTKLSDNNDASRRSSQEKNDPINNGK